MKSNIAFSILLTGLLGMQVMAQQAPPPPDPVRPPPPPDAPAPPDEAQLKRKLEDARRQLEQAAREVAEYSAQIYQENGPHVQRLRVERMARGKGAMLGVAVEETVRNGSNRSDGVDVVGVTPNGPADKAGIKNGDKILAVNGQSLQWQGDSPPTKQLLDIMSDIEPEEVVTVDYVRNGEAASVIVTTERLNHYQYFSGDSDFDFDFNFDEDKIRGIEDKVIVLNDRIKSLYSPWRRPWHDLELMALTPKLGSYFNTDKGILVVSTGKDDKLKLEEGDVIVSIDGREPKDPAHAIRILSSYRSGETVTFEIMRERRKRSVEYVIEEENKDVNFLWRPDDGNATMILPGLPQVHVLPDVEIDDHTVIQQMKLRKEDSI